MGEKPDPVTAALVPADQPAALRAKIAETRGELSATIEQLHTKLNPSALKDQAIEQFHDVSTTVKTELKAHFADAKAAIQVELHDAKQAATAEFHEAKAAIKSEVRTEIDAVKGKLAEELQHAKAAVRAATIGKVEHMIENAKDRAREARRSVVDVIVDHPVPAALVGVGLAWLLIASRRKRHAASEDLEDRDRKRRALPRGEAHDEAEDAAAADDDADAVDASAEADADGNVEDEDDVEDDAEADDADGEAAHHVEGRAKSFYANNPLAVGAAVLAAGTAVGLALPGTRLEETILGAVKGRVVHKVKELARDAMTAAAETATRGDDATKKPRPSS